MRRGTPGISCVPPPGACVILGSCMRATPAGIFPSTIPPQVSEGRGICAVQYTHVDRNNKTYTNGSRAIRRLLDAKANSNTIQRLLEIPQQMPPIFDPD